MEPLIARAFLTLMLTTEQILELKAIEKTLPEGRYLQGFEICRHFKIKPDTLQEFREQNMMKLLWDWRKENVKRDVADNIHAWMDYVLKNWIEPLPQAGSKVANAFSGVNL